MLRPLFQTYKNWAFRGLFWLSKDLYEDKPGFREAIEPDARQLNEIRNHAEHKYLKLHEGEWSPELAASNASDGMGDRLAFSIDRDDFEAKALRILKHARAALIYLSLGVQILDIMHVAEYLWDAAGALETHREHQEAFFYEKMGRVLQGEVRAVITNLRLLATRRNLRGEKRKTINAAYHYFETNLNRMRYDEYLRKGYPIASGAVEGACRHLVKDRLERTGMRWVREGEHGARQTVWELSQLCQVRLAWSPAMFGGAFKGRQLESLTPEDWELIYNGLERGIIPA